MYLPSTLKRPLVFSLQKLDGPMPRLPFKRRPLRDEQAILADVLPKRDVPTSRFAGLPLFRD